MDPVKAAKNRCHGLLKSTGRGCETHRQTLILKETKNGRKSCLLLALLVQFNLPKTFREI